MRPDITPLDLMKAQLLNGLRKSLGLGLQALLKTDFTALHGMICPMCQDANEAGLNGHPVQKQLQAMHDVIVALAMLKEAHAEDIDVMTAEVSIEDREFAARTALAWAESKKATAAAQNPQPPAAPGSTNLH